MRKYIIPIIIFFSVFIIYFGVSTKFTFKPKWALDYFNPLANSILNFRLDIQNPGSTYDLSLYKGKWFVPWGVLVSVFLVPIQLIKGRYIPLLYLSLLFSSLNTVFVYLLLKRIKKEFLHNLSNYSMFIFLILFTFGTTQFYVGTLGSSWHVNQMVTSFLGTLGIYIIFKKKRTTKEYLISSIIFSLALIGRFTVVMLLALPIFLYCLDYFSTKKLTFNLKFLKKFILIFFVPLIFFISISSFYNYIRFEDPLEFGYSYIHESPYLAKIRNENGLSSFKNLINNSRYMLFELPSFDISNKPRLNFNLNGNSIFFLTPPFLAAFLAKPFRVKKRKLILDPYIFSLWSVSIITIVPSLMHYSSGWMQFGYRYSLDITVLLLLLSLFGVKGKANIFYTAGVLFSIVIYLIGINSLM